MFELIPITNWYAWWSKCRRNSRPVLHQNDKKKIKIISDQKYGKSAQHRYLCGLILWDLT